jgi:hypothetical protein
MDPLETIRQQHYTRSVPSGKRRVYVYEGAIVVFAIPANRNISRWLLGEDNRVWELARLWAADGHRANLLTEAIAHAARQLRIDQPEVEALVSYADPNAGHHGGVYRAGSWAYLGQCEESRNYRRLSDGHILPRRAFHSGSKGMRKAEIEALGFKEIKLPGKHRYARGLTRKARRAVDKKLQPAIAPVPDIV